MESIKNEFQGFGENFEGFPKHLPDDSVEYTIFIVDSKLSSQKELLARLEAVRREAQKLTSSLLKDYIWQRDGFSLQVESGKGMPHAMKLQRDEADLDFRSDAPSWPYKLRRFGRR
jgi:hypothetical protein